MRLDSLFSTIFCSLFTKTLGHETEYSIKIASTNSDSIDKIARNLGCVNKGKVVELRDGVIYRFSKKNEREAGRAKRHVAFESTQNYTVDEQKTVIRVKRDFLDDEFLKTSFELKFGESSKSKQTRYRSKYKYPRYSSKRTLPASNYNYISFKYNDPYYRKVM